jgi:hypothetical protein
VIFRPTGQEITDSTKNCLSGICPNKPLETTIIIIDDDRHQFDYLSPVCDFCNKFKPTPRTSRGVHPCGIRGSLHPPHRRLLACVIQVSRPRPRFTPVIRRVFFRRLQAQHRSQATHTREGARAVHRLIGTILPPTTASSSRVPTRPIHSRPSDSSPKARFVSPGEQLPAERNKETFTPTPSAELLRALVDAFELLSQARPSSSILP